MRGSDCSARNALQPQRGARSVVACRALRPRPLGHRGGRLGQARPLAGSHLRSPAGPPSPLRPCPTASAPPTPPPSAAPLVLRRPRHRRRRGPVVLQCAGDSKKTTGAGRSLPLPFVTSTLPPLTVPISSRLPFTRRASPLALALLVLTSRRGGRAHHRMRLKIRGGTPQTAAVVALNPNARRGRHRGSTTWDCTGSAHVHPHPFDRGRPVFLSAKGIQ